MTTPRHDFIAERRLPFETASGKSEDVIVRIGRPFREPADRAWTCAYQIIGLDDERVIPIFGTDAMQALVLAIHSIAAELAALARDGKGRFQHDAHLVGFLTACRTTLEIAGELPDPPDPESHHASRTNARGRFFLNVDLDIETQTDPTPLIQALEPHAYSLERPPGQASFELNVPAIPTTPEPLIREFVRLVEALPAPARAVWDRAWRRVLDIGVESRVVEPFSETHHLTTATLLLVARVRAEIAITVYASAREDANRNEP